MNRIPCFIGCLALGLWATVASATPEGTDTSAKKGPIPKPMRWVVDNTSAISGQKATILGAPVVKKTAVGKAVCFNGESDGLFFSVNPLAGMETFTVEVLFQPQTGGAPEQRFMHLEEDSPNAYRAMVETRVSAKDFYLDTFLNSAGGKKTLANKAAVHPLDQWTWAALTYDGTTMRHFINGVEEAAEPLSFVALGPGKFSLGVRLNKVFWFKGCLREALFTPRAKSPKELKKVK